MASSGLSVVVGRCLRFLAKPRRRVSHASSLRNRRGYSAYKVCLRNISNAGEAESGVVEDMIIGQFGHGMDLNRKADC